MIKIKNGRLCDGQWSIFFLLFMKKKNFFLFGLKNFTHRKYEEKMMMMMTMKWTVKWIFFFLPISFFHHHQYIWNEWVIYTRYNNDETWMKLFFFSLSIKNQTTIRWTKNRRRRKKMTDWINGGWIWSFSGWTTIDHHWHAHTHTVHRTQIEWSIFFCFVVEK